MLFATIMFRRVLVANRGEIAVRIIRSLKYLGIHSIAIFGKEDRISLPTRIADESIYIPHEDPLAAYLDIEAIVTAAVEVRADAVHPGYGFLSENANFAKILEESNIKFIGPSSKLIKMMGDKIQAKKIAKEYGLPVIEGSDGGVSNISKAKEICKKIGFPVLIKAAGGGGGKGMKIAFEEKNFEELFLSAKSDLGL